ncbi:hypothetical protein KR018_012448 [Drosophila ironensis]|nr:hypothetical protein KR018_012448 [Drosophila ironensis]
MWKLQALVAHCLLLVSIMSIYFQSNILSGLSPLPTLRALGQKPPADRLVVFVSDSVDVDSIVKDNGQKVPELRDLFVKSGVVGIATASSPMGSMPAYVAIFAGFNEDPGAALTNWSPSSFDTVFNRSRTAFGWMGKDVADIFTGLPHGGAAPHFNTYKPTSKRINQHVYEKVHEFLTDEEKMLTLREVKSVVFFVHLGKNSSNAIKPTEQHNRENLHDIMRCIRRTHDLFESAFNDSRTAYLMTANNANYWGGLFPKLLSRMGFYFDFVSDGENGKDMETPFIMWGAGVKGMTPQDGKLDKLPKRIGSVTLDTLNLLNSYEEKSEVTTHSLPRLKQIQLAPLMSALIGLPPPVNNMALLPRGFLDVSAEYEFHALYLNVKQLLAQARVLIKRQEDAIFQMFLPAFEGIDSARIDGFDNEVKTYVANKNFETVIRMTQLMGTQAVECIQYYHTYYHSSLLVATTISYLVWFYCLLVQLTRESSKPRLPKTGYMTWMTLGVGGTAAMIFPLLMLQNVPYLTSIYLLMPLGFITVALAERPLENSLIMCPILHLTAVLLPAGLMILMGFNNTHIGILYALIVCLSNADALHRRTRKLFIWLGLVTLLTFILLTKQNSWMDWLIVPIGEYVRNVHVVYFSILVSALRPMLMRHQHAGRVWVVNGSALLFTAYGVYQWDSEERICAYVYAACWSYLVYAFLSIPYSGTQTPVRRLELIMFNMVTLHAMMTNSSESLILQIMITEFPMGLEVYDECKRRKAILGQDAEIDEGVEADEDEEEANQQRRILAEQDTLTPVQHMRQSYRYAILILLYFYVSFFGTGHWFFNFDVKATISRLFLTKFSLHFSAALVLLKIFIPSIIIMACLYTFVSFGRKHTRSIMICLFLMSDAMSLYFCYFFDNKGSGTKMRQSLDYLLVTHVFIILLLLCSWIAKVFLSNTADTKQPMTANQATVTLDNVSTMGEDSQA